MKSLNHTKYSFWSLYIVSQDSANNMKRLKSISKPPWNSASGRGSVLVAFFFLLRFIQYTIKKYIMNRIPFWGVGGFFYISRKFIIGNQDFTRETSKNKQIFKFSVNLWIFIIGVVFYITFVVVCRLHLFIPTFIKCSANNCSVMNPYSYMTTWVAY